LCDAVASEVAGGAAIGVFLMVCCCVESGTGVRKKGVVARFCPIARVETTL